MCCIYGAGPKYFSIAWEELSAYCFYLEAVSVTQNNICSQWHKCPQPMVWLNIIVCRLSDMHGDPICGGVDVYELSVNVAGEKES